VSPKTKTVLVLFAVAGVLTAWLVWKTDWDARAIHLRLNHLAELVTKEGEESTFESMGRSRKVMGFFMSDAYIEYLPRSVLEGTEALGAAFLNVRAGIERASVGLSRHEITVADDGRRAESTVRANARVLARGEEEWHDSLDYHILWQKADGEWRISQVSISSGE